MRVLWRNSRTSNPRRSSERARPPLVRARSSSARWRSSSARLAGWLREGKLRHREDILDGIEQAACAIAGRYRGENLGKRLIRGGPG